MRFKAFDMLRGWAVTGLVVLSAGCSDFIRQDRSPVTLVIDRLEAASGAEDTPTFGAPLFSDVITVVDDVPTVFADNGRVVMRLIMKDVGTAPSAVNAVTINQYRVTYRRTDGRNTPGADVPFPFSSGVTFTVAPGAVVTQPFELVRHLAKAEAPLRALRTSGLIISTIADVTFSGRDQAGNELSTTGSITVEFGNFGDPD